jgi:hypothetical protein
MLTKKGLKGEAAALAWVVRKQKSHISLGKCNEGTGSTVEVDNSLRNLYKSQKFVRKNWPVPKSRGKIKAKPVLGFFEGYESSFEVSLWPKFFPRTLAN